MRESLRRLGGGVMGRALVLALVLVGLPAVASAATVVRLGTVAPEGSRYVKDIRALAEEIERLTGGEVRFKIFAGGRLGDEKAMMTTMMDPGGKLDAIAGTAIGITYAVPEMRAWIFPGLFQDYSEVDFLEQRYREEFAGYFEKNGLVLVAIGDTGFNKIYCDEPITTYEALKKHRLWLWADDETVIAAVGLLGIATDATSLADLVTMLAKKQIDAWVFPPMAVLAWGIQGHVKYMSDMPFNFLSGAIALRKDVFDALAPDQQRAVLSIGRKWEARVMKSWRAEQQKAEKAMVKQGSRVMEWPQAERETFFKETSKARGAYAKKWGIEALMRRMSDDLDKYRAGKK